MREGGVDYGVLQAVTLRWRSAFAGGTAVPPTDPPENTGLRGLRGLRGWGRDTPSPRPYPAAGAGFLRPGDAGGRVRPLHQSCGTGSRVVPLWRTRRQSGLQ